MEALAQALGYDAPLHGEVVVGVERRALVGAPRYAAVVDDDVVAEASAEGVGPVGLVGGERAVAHAEAHVAHYNIVAAHEARVVGKADAVARRRLPGHGEEVARERERRLEVDGARHLEQYRGLRQLRAVAQRTRLAGVFERGDVVHLPAAADLGVAAVSVRPREGRYLRRGLQSACGEQRDDHEFPCIHRHIVFS